MLWCKHSVGISDDDSLRIKNVADTGKGETKGCNFGIKLRCVFPIHGNIRTQITARNTDALCLVIKVDTEIAKVSFETGEIAEELSVENDTKTETILKS